MAMVKNYYIPPQMSVISFCTDRQYLVTTSTLVYDIEQMDDTVGDWLE